MMVKISFQFPAEAIPALKGYQGQKIADTEKVTNTSIWLKRTKDGRGIAKISGENENSVILAKRILELAMKHFEASCQSKEPLTRQMQGAESAALDLETFFFETDKKSSQKQH